MQGERRKNFSGRRKTSSAVCERTLCEWSSGRHIWQVLLMCRVRSPCMFEKTFYDSYGKGQSAQDCFFIVLQNRSGITEGRRRIVESNGVQEFFCVGRSGQVCSDSSCFLMHAVRIWWFSGAVYILPRGGSTGLRTSHVFVSRAGQEALP